MVAAAARCELGWGDLASGIHDAFGLFTDASRFGIACMFGWLDRIGSWRGKKKLVRDDEINTSPAQFCAAMLPAYTDVSIVRGASFSTAQRGVLLCIFLDISNVLFLLKNK